MTMTRYQDDYGTRYKRFSLRIEKLLLTLIILFSLGLVIGQSLYMFPEVRHRLVETDRLEGTFQLP